MPNHITFQFDDNLDYQTEAIKSVVDLFSGVSRQNDGVIYRNINRVRKIGEGDPVRNPQIVREARLLKNLREMQLRNKLMMDNELKDKNFTIEMETGTGKTYVYLRTILELNKIYGFTKFMIVVPSIAIRKGIEKSIDMLREHFKDIYDGRDIKNNFFVYDSKNLQKLSSSFVGTRDLSVVVMNIQAFNKSTNKIRQSDEYGQIIWEDIKYINPIIIIDEPQKIEGSVKKKSASLEAIEMLHPLFTLRYSATHKRLFNQVYKLDSYDAYKNDLVKKIRVKTVHGTIPKDYPYVRYVEFTKDLYAKIEIFSVEQGGVIRFKQFKVRGGDSLYECSGNLKQYKNMFVLEDPHKLKKLKISKWDERLELAIGESNMNFGEEETIRIQIRLAIKNHLEKQYELLKAGYSLKVLTLFFIDAVNKFRDNNAADGRGQYLRIFDEEYTQLITDPKWGKVFKEYRELFKQYTDIQKVREGYFAIDKHKNAVEIENWDTIMDEQKLKAKSQEDIDRGIDLILDKKDELISFDEPLAFIFSHSALREGWDNPNVFTLCTLKKSGSDIAKKQEIGRGLRLPVDSNGNRIKNSDVNELTVVANDYYDHFAETLQQDFNENSGFNKDEVTYDVIYNTLKEAGIPDSKIMEVAEIFKAELIQRRIINEAGVLTKEAKHIESIDFNNEILKEHTVMIKKKFVEEMLKKGTKKIHINNGDESPIINSKNSYVSEDYFKKLLRELSERMSKRTLYQVDINSDEFINACVFELNEKLKYKNIKFEYVIESGNADFDDLRKFKMSEATPQKMFEELTGMDTQKSEFEIINYIMYHTMLPRLAIYKIIKGLEKEDLLRNQDILDQVTQEIKKTLTDFMATGNIKYEVIDGYVFEESTIFEMEQIDRVMLDDATSLVFKTNVDNRRAINMYYKFDSKGELEFAKRLDIDEDVLLYTKLKKGGFVINTPYGEYSPDWAVIRKGNENIARLFFIVETKIDKDEKDLTDVEKAKIKCGKLHFKAVANDVEFKQAKNYDDFLEKIGVK
ncbi:DEAD/DEAH box helicase family protein [Sporolactobacillus sp. STSJ-5]|uniref:restriction endonuclease n=1 Tax=Sporolactobacillus sp. STSJ-5 TaxID=2965076 RepID=UPI002105E521|nr:DEAD/DEAH box helicase family protein [Sporolactobacillus sp. STSJ-5]MCQ2011181.1 DEAD/DEAH box helicase family protein [Sporolactobacillus sp. STSJ-5]